MVEFVFIVVVLIAGIVFTKDISIIFKNIIVVLIIRFMPAKVLFVNILFVNIKTN